MSTLKIDSFQVLDNKVQEIGLYNLEYQQDGNDHVFTDKWGNEVFRIEESFNSINRDFKEKYLLDLTDLKLSQIESSVVDNQLHSLNQKIENLIDGYREVKKDTSWWERNNIFDDEKYRKEGRKNLKNNRNILIEPTIRKLKSIQEHLEDEIMGTGKPVSEHYLRKVWNYENNLVQISENIAKSHTGSMGDMPPLDIDSKKEAEKAGDKMLDFNKHLQEFNALLLVVDVLEIDGDEKQRFRNWLLEVSSDNIDEAARKPYTLKYYDDYNYLISTYPFLFAYLTYEDAEKDKQAPGNKREKRRKDSKENKDTDLTKINKRVCSVKYNSVDDAMRRGGALGALDYWMSKSNMTQGQREFFSGAAQVAGAVGVAVLGWNVIKNAWKIIWNKDGARSDPEAWGWVVGALGVGVATTAGLGRAPWELNKISSDLYKVFKGDSSSGGVSSLFGGTGGSDSRTGNNSGGVFYPSVGGENPSEDGEYVYYGEDVEESSEEVRAYYYGAPRIAYYFNGMKNKDILKFVEKDPSGKMVIKDYDALIEYWKGKRGDNAEKAVASLEFMKENGDEGYLVHYGLEGIGLTYDEMKDDPDGKFDDLYATYAIRFQLLDKYLKYKKYGLSQSEESMKLLKSYLSGELGSNPVVLEGKGVYVQRPEDLLSEEEVMHNLSEKLKIKKAIQEFKWDEQQKVLFSEAMDSFFENRPTRAKNINIEQDGDRVLLETYGKTTVLDIPKSSYTKSLNGFEKGVNSPIMFANYQELITSANFVNWLKFHFGSKKNYGEAPFYLSSLGKITFRGVDEDGSRDDTNIIGGWMNSLGEWMGVSDSSLSKISPTFDSNKPDFINYLNGIKNSDGTSFWKNPEKDTIAPWYTWERWEEEFDDLFESNSVSPEQKKEIENEVKKIEDNIKENEDKPGMKDKIEKWKKELKEFRDRSKEGIGNFFDNIKDFLKDSWIWLTGRGKEAESIKTKWSAKRLKLSKEKEKELLDAVEKFNLRRFEGQSAEFDLIGKDIYLKTDDYKTKIDLNSKIMSDYVDVGSFDSLDDLIMGAYMNNIIHKVFDSQIKGQKSNYDKDPSDKYDAKEHSIFKIDGGNFNVMKAVLVGYEHQNMFDYESMKSIVGSGKKMSDFSVKLDSKKEDYIKVLNLEQTWFSVKE